MDINGQPKLISKRNHPRTLAEPYGSLWYAANNDLQFLLINATSTETWNNRGSSKEEYEKFSNNLIAVGCAGFKHHNGSHITTEYTTKYQCKGDINSEAWQASSRSCTEAFCNKPENANKTVRSLIAKQMGNITNTLSEPKDKRVNMLAGGLLKRATADGHLKKISVTSINIDELSIYNSVPTNGTVAAPVVGIAVDHDVQQDTSDENSFTWLKITTKYKSRSNDFQSLHVGCIPLVKKNSTIPQFLGYDNCPTWPMKEEYSKRMLTFFKPQRYDINKLKAIDGTYKTALEEYMWEVPNFPWQIRQQLLRIKRNEKSVDLSASGELNGDENEFSPTNNREHSLNNQAAEAADHVMDEYDLNNREDDNEDIADEVFRTINMRVPEDHDWSITFNILLSTSLAEPKKKYYEEQMINYNQSHEGIQVQLLHEDLHHPENAKTDAQRFIIYHHLYWQWIWSLFRNGEINEIPPMQKNYVEGVPGVGKTFVINTLL